MLLALYLLWWIAASALLFLIHCYAVWDHPSPYRPTFSDFFEPEVLLLTGITSLLLGGLQFGTWKAGLWHTRRRGMKVGTGVFGLLFILGIIYLSLLAKENQYRGAEWGLHSTNDYERLIRNGDCREAVRLMEESCEWFDYSKQQLGGDIGGRGMAGHGFSHLFNGMYLAWDSLDKLAPTSIFYTLSDLRHDGFRNNGHLGGYGPWRPMAEELHASEAPILKAMGAFLLDDLSSFAEISYALADQDPDAKPLAAFASLKDPIGSRAIGRIHRYQSDGTFASFVEYDNEIFEYVNRRLEKHGSNAVK